jgi:hypothetical protein
MAEPVPPAGATSDADDVQRRARMVDVPMTDADAHEVAGWLEGLLAAARAVDAALALGDR